MLKGSYHTEEARKKMSIVHLANPTKYWLGKHLSEEHRKKLSESHKDKILSVETRRKMSKVHKGIIFSKEHRKHMSESQKGKHLSEEHKRKLSESHKGKNNFWYGTSGPMGGKHHTEEARRKISKAGEGRYFSEETRKKIGDKHRGKSISQEMRKKLRESRLHQIIPKKDTKIEIRMQKSLEERNIIFEKHKPIFGQPDIFIKPNICVFCDGDYWHANPSIYKADKLVVGNKTARSIWKKDKNIKEKLEKQGFKVFRFWEHQINNNINDCIKEILSFTPNCN